METFEAGKDKIKISVLMSVYKKENPAYFRQAVESVVNQTVKPDEIVIVKDGPLTNELEEVCNELLHEYKRYIRFVPLEKNMGLGLALQKGVTECRNQLIARMDTDDIAKLDRFEKQLKVFEENSDIAVCGGYIEEFSEDVNRIDSIRKVPLENKDIYEFAKKRNPFNHMTVMFRKGAVLDAGNYQPFYLLEDYYLWFRMLLNGEKMVNLSDILVSVRGGRNMVARRGGWKYFKNEKRLYEIFKKQRYISEIEYLCMVFIRGISRLMPNVIRRKIYGCFLR